MAAPSPRVRTIAALVEDLSTEERAQLEELLVDDPGVGEAWGKEIDERAERARSGERSPLSRAQLTALLDMSPREARAHLSLLLAPSDAPR